MSEKTNEVKLEALKQSADAIASIHSLLSFGQFQGAHVKDLTKAFAMLEEFHKQLSEQINALESTSEPASSPKAQVLGDYV